MRYGLLKGVLLWLVGVLLGGAIVFTWIYVVADREFTAWEQCRVISDDLVRILEKRSDGAPSQAEIDEMLRSLNSDGKLIVKGKRGLPVNVWHREFEVTVSAGDEPGVLKVAVRSTRPNGGRNRSYIECERTVKTGAR